MEDRIGFFFLLIVAEFGSGWYSRLVFIASGYCRRYGHGKTWKRAHKHYKTNWTFLQRLFWVMVFKEQYESDFCLLAYFAYLQSFFAIVLTLFTVLGLYHSIAMRCVGLAYCAIVLIRYIHADYVAREGTPKKRKK